MSSMKKRIPMFLLALAMMVAMALPTFADSPCSFCYIRRAVSISIRAGKGGTAWIWLSLQSPIRGWQQAHRRPRYAGFSGN